MPIYDVGYSSSCNSDEIRVNHDVLISYMILYMISWTNLRYWRSCHCWFWTVWSCTGSDRAASEQAILLSRHGGIMTYLRLFIARFLARCALIGARRCSLATWKRRAALTSFKLADSDPGHLEALAGRVRHHRDNKLLRRVYDIIVKKQTMISESWFGLSYHGTGMYDIMTMISY